MAAGKVALVTGSNAGLGLTLCDRLLLEHPGLRLCLACRNKQRAEIARKSLQLSHPESEINVILIDTSSIKSVYIAAQEIKKKYARLDFLYLNAGIMPVIGFNWQAFIKGIFSSEVVHMFTTGKGLLKQEDRLTDEGLCNVFNTNVFGHYILIRQLEDIMGCRGQESDHVTQIIWTSSSAALRENFDIHDIQHKKGSDPYSSSKYAADLLSISLNEELNKKGIYSHTMCPGLVMTNITYNIMPALFWTLVWPLMLLLRFFVPSMNYETFNGSEAQVWLSHQCPEKLDARVKFCSETTVFGKRYIHQRKLQVNDDEKTSLFKQIQVLENEFKHKYKSIGQGSSH